MTKTGSIIRTVMTDDLAAILNIQRGTLSTLNPTGAYVWQALERGESVEVIVENLARETSMPRETVERDVRAFVAALKQQNLMS